MEHALIYAYKIKNTEKESIVNDKIYLAYQVKQPLFSYQCDFGKNFTAHMLKEFKESGGLIKIINDKKELVLPLNNNKILVPVPDKLLKEYRVKDLID